MLYDSNLWIRSSRSRKNFQLASRLTEVRYPGLPLSVAKTVVATCRFCVQGPESVGQSAKNWGQWVRTRIQTHGYRPRLSVWQGTGGWLTGDSQDCANYVLEPFNLTIQDVFDYFGQPTIGKTYMVDLVDIVQALRPELVADEATAVA